MGSSAEVESHLQFAFDVELIPRAIFEARKAEVIEVRKMLIGLRKRISPPPVGKSHSL
ncbi:MAG: four helix bundle protein [Gemmatimonadaceae bacterium]